VADRHPRQLPPGHGRQRPRHQDRQLWRVRGARVRLEGLLHISEIADQKVEKPEDIVKVGQEVDVKILRVDSDERKIGLSLKRAQWAQEEEKREEVRAERTKTKGLKAAWKVAKAPPAWATSSSASKREDSHGGGECSRPLSMFKPPPPQGAVLFQVACAISAL